MKQYDQGILRTEYFMRAIQDGVSYMSYDAYFTEERIQRDINDILQEYAIVQRKKYAWWINTVGPEDLSDELCLNQKKYKDLLIEAKFALQELDGGEKIHYKDRYTNYLSILYQMVVLHIIDIEIYQQLDPPSMA